MSDLEKNFQLECEDSRRYKYICRECSKETMHTIIAAYIERGSEGCGNGNFFEWSEISQIIQCQGCETVSFRVESTNSDECEYDYDTNTKYSIPTIKFYPGRSVGLKASDSYLLPVNVQEIYKETILAIENEQNILAGIGIRALIETVCKDREAIGRDLHAKIDSLHEKGIVTLEGAGVLHRLRVLGNEAAHEVKKHSQQQLLLAIKVIEHMLDGTYIIPQSVLRVLK